MQSFLGLAGYYRNFIPDYSTITSPLSDLTKKGYPNKIIWKKEQEEAYNLLKEKVSSYPILKLTTRLFQNVHPQNRCFKYGSWKCFDAEIRWQSIPNLLRKQETDEAGEEVLHHWNECLAIIWAVKKFNNYLYGTEFTLETDDNTLLYLERAKFVNARVMRWSLCLHQYRMNIQYIKGSLNCTADYLSRIDN